MDRSVARMMWAHSNSFQIQNGTIITNSGPFICLIDVEITKEYPTPVHEIAF